VSGSVTRNGAIRLARVAVLFLGGVALLAAVGRRTLSPSAAAPTSLEEQWGVSIQGVRLSAGGHIVDFRYRILDPEKALPIVDRTKKAYLVHQATGAALAVPEAPTIGPLRQTEKFGKPQAGRTYVVLFANAGRLVQPGDQVTVKIGDFRVSDLVAH